MKTAVIVGSGLAGLTAAFRLRQQGWETLVLEANHHPGGRVRSIDKGGFLLDVGPTLITNKYTEYLQLVDELGLREQLVDSSSVIGVAKGSDLYLLDAARPLSSFIRTRLLSPAQKLRLLSRGLQLIKPLWRLNPYELSDRVHYDTVAMDAYLNSVFGPELNESLLAAVARGVTLSTPEEASVIEFFAGAAAAAGKMQNLIGGMEVLPQAMAKNLDVRLNCRVTAVANLHGRVELHYENAGEQKTLQADACVLTTRFKDAVALYPAAGEWGRALYENTYYTGCYSLQLLYSRRTKKEPFIIMVPSSVSAEVSTVFLEHVKSPDRAPAGKSQLTVFFNLNSPFDFASWSEQRLTEVAREFVERLFPELRNSLEDSYLTRWDYAAHKGNVGYYKALYEFLDRYPASERVQLAGDYMAVSGQESAVVAGNRAARRILAQ